VGNAIRQWWQNGIITDWGPKACKTVLGHRARIIDIRDQQIIVTYPDTVAGIVPTPEFNGYVLDS
jgi:hypothetical protein